MTARVGVVTFPGSLDDRDAARAVRRAGAQATVAMPERDRLRPGPADRAGGVTVVE